MSTFEMRVTVLCAVALLAWPAPSVAQHERVGRVTGVVADRSAGVLPGVVVSAVVADGRTVSTTVTAGAGEFAFERLPAGAIELRFHLDGFTDATARVVIPPGAATGVGVPATVRQTMELETFGESVVVRGDDPTPAPPSKPRPALQPVAEHDPSAVCGPAKAEGLVSSVGTVVSEGRSSRGLFGARDELLIDGGSRAGIRVGDNFIVRRRYETPLVEKRRAVRRYDTSLMDKRRVAVMGEHSAGLVQIVSVDADVSTALVVYSCDEIMSGDYIVPFEPESPGLPEPHGAPLFDRAARILFADDGQSLGIPNRMLVIDRGALDGVRTGQRFTLFRRSSTGPARSVVVGEAIVVATRRDSATIRIEQASDAVVPGADGDWAAPQQPLQQARQ